MKEIKLKRLWNNIASLRDCDVKKYIVSNTTVKITVNGLEGYMIVTPQQMREKSFQAVDTTFDSSYVPGMKYRLIDFAWKPVRVQTP